MAYWSDADAVDGESFDSGQLRLEVAAPATGCGAWMLDDPEEAAVAYNPATMKVVPGDVLTRDCTFLVKAEGRHLRATVDIGDANFTPGGATAFGGMLSGVVSNLEVGAVGTWPGGVVTELTEAHDEGILTVGVAVTFASAAGNTTQDLTTVLDNLSIVTTQQHD